MKGSRCKVTMVINGSCCKVTVVMMDGCWSLNPFKGACHMTNNPLLLNQRTHNESDIDEQLKAIAKHSLGTGSKYMFELKPEFEDEYSPFFYHYSKSDHSKVR